MDLYNRQAYLEFKNLFESKLKNGKTGNALSEIDNILNAYPDHPGILYLAGLLYKTDKEFIIAKKYFQKAWAMDEGPIEYIKNIGYMEVEMDELKEAERILGKLKNELVSDSEYCYYLAKLYFKQLDMKKAVKYGEQSYQLESNYAICLLLGDIYNTTGTDYEQAIDYYKQAIKFSKDEEAYYQLINAYYISNQQELFEKEAQRFFRRFPNSNYYQIIQQKMSTLSQQTDEQLAIEIDEAPAKEQSRNDKIFDRGNQIAAATKTIILDQEEYIDQLVQGFVRSSIYQSQKSTLRNVIYSSGHKGIGKRKAIQYIAKKFKESGLYKNDDFIIVDLKEISKMSDSKYAFINQIFEIQASSAQIVLFENVNHLDKSNYIILADLIQYGRIKLKDIYVGSMNDSLSIRYNALVQGVKKELVINDKLLILDDEQDFNKLKQKLPASSMESIKNIAHASPLSKSTVQQIIKKRLDKTIKKILLKLQIDCSYEEAVIPCIYSHLEAKMGIHSVKEILNEVIYQQIAEGRMTNRLNPGMRYSIIVKEGNLYITDYIEEMLLTINSNSVEEIENIKKQLNNIIGLEKVKQSLFELEDFLNIQNMREQHGKKSAPISMNLVFTGNPGTGKTTIARLTAQYLKAIGYLSSGHLVEVDQGDLIAQYVGQTAPKTQQIIESALGGVLFIDEAYSLAKQGGSFGQEAIDTIVKAMEDNRNDLVIVVAGYKEEMKEFFKANPGLKSRFNQHIDFPDYTHEELVEITKVIAESLEYRLTPEIEKPLLELYEKLQILGKNDSGNGRLARNILEEAIKVQSNRIKLLNQTSEVTSDMLSELTLSDFKLNEIKAFNLEESLHSIVGLEEVKKFMRSLQLQLNAIKLRKSQGIKVSNSQTLNMIFTGNPGTGKTMIARMIGEMMKDMGLLKSGHFVETSRGDLVAQYLGQTAPKTTEVFMSALGGVLLIDEAYTLKSDSYGKEAIDTLVKLIEDHRDNVVVILAGYEKDMDEFLDTNAGLKSRFPISINFKDYNVNELFQMAQTTIAKQGFLLDQRANEALLERLHNEMKIATADSGNGRMVRNLIEEAQRLQAVRIGEILAPTKEQLMQFVREDFMEDKKGNDFDLEKELSNIIGLNDVKNIVRELNIQLQVKVRQQSVGIYHTNDQNLNMIFTGNPGTGKTTIARVVSELFLKMGLLKSNKVVEVDKSALVSAYAGQTPEKVQKVFKSALGGVLFIDEAYTLKNDQMGQEAINTLVKLVEDYKDGIIVILAGYEKEMREFLDVNPGLYSRFPISINFPDYNADELVEIAKLMLRNKKYNYTEDTLKAMRKKFDQQLRRAKGEAGNGRLVRNIIEEVIRKQNIRIVKDEIYDKEGISFILPSDVEDKNETQKEYDLEGALKSIIGLEEVKNVLRGLHAKIKINSKRKALGLPIDEQSAMHMVFTGNPGTGKTTVARIVGNLLYDLGVISTNKVVEVDRSGLVAGYVGQTAIKTQEVIKKALGGVLFIDEAYTLSSDKDSQHSFGSEAIDIILKGMEDHRDNLVVIFAGYKNEMEEFLDMNPGLRSRIPYMIEFKDYSASDLIKIFEGLLNEKQYTLNADAMEKVIEKIILAKNDKQFGNGRYVRNLYEEIIRKQSIRLERMIIENVSITKEQFMQIEVEDLK